MSLRTVTKPQKKKSVVTMAMAARLVELGGGAEWDVAGVALPVLTLAMHVPPFQKAIHQIKLPIIPPRLVCFAEKKRADSSGNVGMQDDATRPAAEKRYCDCIVGQPE